MSILDKLSAMAARALGQPPTEKPAPTVEPCDLYSSRAPEGEETCAACGQPWWMHHRWCDFDEVGAENEQTWRADGGQPPIPPDEEPCDACGETRAEHERRARANGYRNLAEMQEKLAP